MAGQEGFRREFDCDVEDDQVGFQTNVDRGLDLQDSLFLEDEYSFEDVAMPGGFRVVSCCQTFTRNLLISASLGRMGSWQKQALAQMSLPAPENGFQARTSAIGFVGGGPLSRNNRRFFSATLS